MKMKRAIMIDGVTGKSWDLTSLIEREGEISVGRAGFENAINLGEGLSLEILAGKTKQEAVRILDAIKRLATVSRHHATITYQMRGWDGEGFYIQNNSKNPIKIGDSEINSEDGKASLNFGLEFEIYFGTYPVKVKYNGY